MSKQMSNEEFLAALSALEARVALAKASGTYEPTPEAGAIAKFIAAARGLTLGNTAAKPQAEAEAEPFGWKLDALKAERGYGEAIGAGLRSGADFVVDTTCDGASFVADTVVDTAAAVGGFASGFWRGLTGSK